MAKYSDIKGFTVQTLSSDTATSGIAAGSWASGGSLNTARGYFNVSQVGTQTATLAVGGAISTGVTAKTENWNGSSWTEVNDQNEGRSTGYGAGLVTAAFFAGGFSPGITNLIDFITTATTGNAQDFGDLTQAGYMMCGCSSPVRGVIGARGIYPAGTSDIMDYITIASTGDAGDFGDSTLARQASAGCSNGHGGLG